MDHVSTGRQAQTGHNAWASPKCLGPTLANRLPSHCYTLKWETSRWVLEGWKSVAFRGHGPGVGSSIAVVT